MTEHYWQEEPIVFPLDLKPGTVHLYLPITEEMRGLMKDSIYQFSPTLKIRADEGNVYYMWPLMQTGPFDRSNEWTDHYITAEIIKALP